MKSAEKKRVKFSFRKIKYKREYLAILTIAVAVFALYQTFSPKNCGDFECFKERMKYCSPTKYFNEGEEATWLYQIQGVDGNKCAVRVTLLNAKEGDLGLREIEDDSMTCFYKKGTIAYPERDLGSCTGKLKEGLQSIVIERLYDYVVVNLEDIREELIFS
jgi:hypothetical protein